MVLKQGIAVSQTDSVLKKCVFFSFKSIEPCLREGESKEEFSETFAVLDKDQDTVISREGHNLNASTIINKSRTMLMVLISFIEIIEIIRKDLQRYVTIRSHVYQYY